MRKTFGNLSKIFILTLLVGCSDYNLQSIPPEPYPEIEVTPTGHDFGALNASGLGQDMTISISNVGTDTLELHGISFVNIDSTFSMTALAVNSLEPGEHTEVIVTYDPATYELNSNIVSILSNDEDERNVLVPINGVGDAPVIEITPDYHDFGSIYLGCDDTVEITVENIGNVDLEVSDIEYFASIPVDFSLQDHEFVNGILPWTIPPGGAVDLKVDYIPLDIYDDSAYIEITSNDPLRPIVTSNHDGLGDYERFVVDNFEQDGMAITDILFVIDNSGSMGSNQTNFKNNFDSFINVFSSAGVDYQIGFITTDNEDLVNGTIVTNLTPDPIAEVNTIVDSIGTWGSAHEKGLYYSYLATQPGGDAGIGSAFLRTDAKLVVIYVSDEPDFSSASVSTSDVSSHLLSLKSSPGNVVAHAVAGDFPSGCTSNGGASFGDGYYDVVNDLGGTFMSICASDFGAQMDTLARDSMALTSFNLSEGPIESTIEVYVDGALSTDWVYDFVSNSVSFTIAPADGSVIDISYAAWAECDGDTGS